MTIAITRKISPRFNECELTHIERTPIDIDIARAQHSEYIRVLSDLGCKVTELPEEPDLPDSVFIEDTAFILPEVAVITRPGARSRLAEIDSVTKNLAALHSIVKMEPPATLDGGDVLVMNKNIFVGLSTRSNQDAIEQLEEVLDPFDYRVMGVEINGCLHLKSAVTRVDEKTLLINKNWVDNHPFLYFKWIEVDDSEPLAANCLPVNGEIIYPAGFPKTQERLEREGYPIRTVAIDELAKAEGAVTCCSLIISD